MAGPEVMDASIPAANGFFTARALATMYAVYAGGGALGDVRLFSPDRVRQIGEEQNNRRDLVLVMPMRWRLGYHRVLGNYDAAAPMVSATSGSAGRGPGPTRPVTSPSPWCAIGGPAPRSATSD